MILLYILIGIFMVLAYFAQDPKAKGTFQLIGMSFIILNVLYVLGVFS